MKTKVIFRKFKDVNKDIIALFPEEAYNGVGAGLKSGLCQSYMHLGQHSCADYNFVISSSIPAKPEKYEELKKELEKMGYDLDIKKRKIAQK